MSSKSERRRKTKASKSTRAWPIEVTKAEFDRFFYPYGINIASKDVKEHLVSLRLVEKLQDPTITEQIDPTRDQLYNAEESGEMVWPTHKLAVDEHTFLFEEDEKRLLLSRLEKNIGRVPPAIGAEFEVLRQKVIAAEPMDLAPPVEEDEEESVEEPEAEDCPVHGEHDSEKSPNHAGSEANPPASGG